MTVSASFEAKGLGGNLLVRHGESFTYDVSGTFEGTVVLQQATGKGGWVTLATLIEPGSGTVLANGLGKSHGRYRFACIAFTAESGTAVTSMTDVLTETQGELKTLDGAVYLRATEAGLASAGSFLTPNLSSPNVTTGLGCVMAIERTFTETAGAGVWTGSVAVPAGATILDIIVNAVALWNSETSATMKVGEADDDGYYIDIDLKATDLLAGESLSFALAGGQAGAYIANSQVSPRYAATARTVTGIITKVGDTGTAGRTRMTVIYALPVTADIVAATKV